VIQLSLGTALWLYSGALLVIVLASWLYTELSVRRPQRALGKQFLWRCCFCGYTYLDESASSLSECPQCGSFNSAGDKRARVVPGEEPPMVPARAAQSGDASSRNPSRRKRPGQRRRGPRRRR
jgi:hypothetical protein